MVAQRTKHRVFLLLAMFMLPLALEGCASLKRPGAPAPAFDMDADIKALEVRFGTATSINNYYATPPETVEKRNEFVAGRLALINLEYIKFIEQFATERAQMDSAFDITKIGVDLAATLTGGAATKSILAAVSAGLTGAHASIQKNFFEDKTVPVLISEMNARRKEALLPILQGTTESLAVYPLPQAVADLDDYYQAGTFNGALQSIQKSAGTKEATADVDLKRFRSSIFREDSDSDRLIKWMYPSGKMGVGSAQSDHVNLVKQWRKQHLPGLPIQKLLDDPDLATERQRAISDLSVPE